MILPQKACLPEQASYFLKISLEALKEFNIETAQIHHGTTSVSVWGAYENSRYGGSPFEITFGLKPRIKDPILYSL